MDLLPANSTTNSTLGASSTPVFGDNVYNLLSLGTLHVNPSSIITVNSIADVVGSDNGVTTLRDAINQANADTGEDLIVFDHSLFSTQQTITLNLGQLDITHNLDIIAPRDSLTGENLVTVSGNNATRVFEIEKGATVNLSGLIVADGNVNNNDGGGIKNSGMLTLDNSIVANNIVANNTVNLNLDNTIGGGGIYNTGILKVNNSTLSGNKATSGTGTGSNIFGGGIYNKGTLEVNNSTLTGNSNTNGSPNCCIGGGIFNSFGGMVTLSNSTLNNNLASGNPLSFGGGIYNDGTLTVSNSTLSHNQASAKGKAAAGGIYNTGTLEVSDSTLDNNSAIANTPTSGGGIWNSGTVAVSNSTLSGNSTQDGGGISNFGGTVTVSNSTLSGNSAVGNRVIFAGFGGGIWNSSSGTVAVSNSTLSGNSAKDNGGGISNFSGTVTVSNSTLSGNSAPDGGGISNFATMTVSNSTLSGNTLSGNSAVGGRSNKGGGIYNSYGGILTLVFSTLTGNQAASGGGLYQDNVPSSLFPNQTLGSNSVRNTIIAANLLGTNGVNPDVSGTFTSNGYNLIGDSTGSTGFDEATGDIVGTSDNPIDPRLAPLDFYGGSTQTIALLPDSPAIDAGDPTVLDTDPTTDQRGFPRVSGVGSDIGAFELSSV